jgi:hypothetical protein
MIHDPLNRLAALQSLNFAHDLGNAFFAQGAG